MSTLKAGLAVERVARRDATRMPARGVRTANVVCADSAVSADAVSAVSAVGAVSAVSAMSAVSAVSAVSAISAVNRDAKRMPAKRILARGNCAVSAVLCRGNRAAAYNSAGMVTIVFIIVIIAIIIIIIVAIVIVIINAIRPHLHVTSLRILFKILFKMGMIGY